MTRRSIIFRTVWAGIFLLCTCMAEAQSFKASHLKNAYERLQLRQRSPLFSAKMRTLLPSPIYDYLEFAWLSHKYHLSENKLQEQKIMFKNGTWSDLEQIRPANDCTIDNRDDNTPYIKKLRVVTTVTYSLKD